MPHWNRQLIPSRDNRHTQPQRKVPLGAGTRGGIPDNSEARVLGLKVIRPIEDSVIGNKEMERSWVSVGLGAEERFAGRAS